MKQTCENCGCKVYSKGCVNCNEENYILEQYYEQGIKTPNEETEFMKKVLEDEKNRLHNNNME
jgi:hypothetical protein